MIKLQVAASVCQLVFLIIFFKNPDCGEEVNWSSNEDLLMEGITNLNYLLDQWTLIVFLWRNFHQNSWHYATDKKTVSYVYFAFWCCYQSIFYVQL